MRTLGVLSGTSVDAIDIALVDWSGEKPTCIAHAEYPWPSMLQHRLLSLPEAPTLTLSAIGQLDTACGEAFANAIQHFMLEHDIAPHTIDVIGSHGQTVWHEPHGDHPYSLQLGHPAIIAKRTGIATAGDFRMDDIALGGQGAPLAPAFHEVLFGATETVGVLNLGGIANLTLLQPHQPTMGFDIGPANTLLDAWFRRHHTDETFDRNGAWAASERHDLPLLSQLKQHPYFAQPAPKSTGREDFSLVWLDAQLQQHAHLTPAQVQSTLLKLTIDTVAQAWFTYNQHATGKLWLCGGGVHNHALITGLKQALPMCQLDTTDNAGYPANALEAMLFAWLAKQRLTHASVTLTHITGQQKPAVLGGLWLGR